MRPIKFRAWDKEKKDWLHNTKPFLDAYEASLYISDLELMQFTGLLDKNGIEIYEGDLIRNHKKASEYSSDPSAEWIDIWEVFWNEERFIYELRGEKYSCTPWLWSETINSDGKRCCEVIGNIYENIKKKETEEKCLMTQ